MRQKDIAFLRNSGTDGPQKNVRILTIPPLTLTSIKK